MKGLDISLEDSIIVSLAEIIFLFIKCLKKNKWILIVILFGLLSDSIPKEIHYRLGFPFRQIAHFFS